MVLEHQPPMCNGCGGRIHVFLLTGIHSRARIQSLDASETNLQLPVCYKYSTSTKPRGVVTASIYRPPPQGSSTLAPIPYIGTRRIFTKATLWRWVLLFSFFSKQASCDMEKLSTSLKVRQLVERDDVCPEQLPLLEPQGCATPGCWIESLHLSPLTGCHHQPAEEWAEKHGLRASSYLSAESRFLECEMRSPPASHNMALLRLIRHRLLVSRSSVTAVHRGEETWETLLLHQPPLLLGRSWAKNKDEESSST